MGGLLCEFLDADPDLQLTVAVDPELEFDPTIKTMPQLATSRDQVDPSQVDVAIDFTVASVALQNALWCAQHGIHTIIGTTGLSESDLTELKVAFGDANGERSGSPSYGNTKTDSSGSTQTANCLVAPNFAVGIVMLMRFAEMASPFFTSAEVIEQHHDGKVDAPSGTAIEIMRRMERVSTNWQDDPTQHELIEGVRGGKGPANIPVHSVRLSGLVAHHQILFGGEGEVLTLRHDSLDRSSFMSGVLHACRVIEVFHGLTFGLAPYLDLE